LTDLFHHGLFRDAIDYSRWLGDQYPDHETARRTLAICEAIIQSRQNNHPQAFNAFKDAFPDYAHYILPRYLGFLLLPLAHDTLINEEAKKNKLDPLLVTSLIRQESFFRANAVSPAEAYGLMQLLVRTAQEVNPFTGRITAQNLQNPNINIRLGCRYLRKLLDRYQNQTYLALAAYNAGPDRVDAWISQLGKVKPEEFIELIPFSETRLYIKNILRNMYFYRHYYPDRFPAATP
jgi:soluble lytic murein transglycosylase